MIFFTFLTEQSIPACAENIIYIHSARIDRGFFAPVFFGDFQLGNILVAFRLIVVGIFIFCCRQRFCGGGGGGGGGEFLFGERRISWLDDRATY